MKFVYSHEGTTQTLEAVRVTDGVEIELEGERALVHIVAINPPRLTFFLNGRTVNATIATRGKQHWLHVNGATLLLTRSEAVPLRPSGQVRGPSAVEVTAPMPGQVRELLVNQGEVVAEGQPLMLLEAMKMEIRVTSPHPGTLAALYVERGQSVERDQVLAIVKERAPEAAVLPPAEKRK